ncbi:MAG: gluconate 2-dehydrogenase subunit 3 family protein [Stenotrophomonas maltophilia]
MASRNRVFTDDQRDLLSSVLNRLIPPEGELPGAGDLGLVTFLEGAVQGEAHSNRLFNEGLTQIAIAATIREPSGFEALNDDGKDAALKEVEASHPEFFGELVRQTYNGYYTNPSIFQLIGYSERPPRCTSGNLELLDESLLEQQRQRAPFWRRS